MQRSTSCWSLNRETFLKEERVISGGYGYGIFEIFDEKLGRVVGHSGGLPGYGSNMTWLPERNVAIAVLANSTYSVGHRSSMAMLEALLDEDLLPDKTPVAVHAEIQTYANQLVALANNWNAASVPRLFSENVALDMSFTDRQNKIADVLKGDRVEIETITGINNSSATVYLVGESGQRYKLDFSLTSSKYASVQQFELVRA